MGLSCWGWWLGAILRELIVLLSHNSTGGPGGGAVMIGFVIICFFNFFYSLLNKYIYFFKFIFNINKSKWFINIKK
jgi:hypothetical protein